MRHLSEAILNTYKVNISGLVERQDQPCLLIPKKEQGKLSNRGS